MNRIIVSILIVLQLNGGVADCQVNIDLLPVRVDGKWGYIDTNGDIIIKPRFDRAQFFTTDNYAVVAKDGLIGMINLKGKVVLEPIYQELKILDENRIGFRKDSLWGMIDNSGQEIMSNLFHDINTLDENHYQVKMRNGYGVINKQGKLIVNAVFDEVIPFLNEFFISTSGNKKGLFNLHGDAILLTECQEIRSLYDKYIMFKRDGFWGCVNNAGNVLFKPEWLEYKAFNQNFIKVKKDVWSLYCTNSKKLISDTAHSNYYHFNTDYVQFLSDYMFGLLDKNGDVVLKPLYDEIAPTSVDLFKIKSMALGHWGLFKKGDRKVVDYKYDAIENFYNNVAKVRKDNLLGLVNTSGRVLVSPRYTNIEVVNNVVKAYRYKSRKVIHINDNGNIINNSNYNNVLSINVGSRKQIKANTDTQPAIIENSEKYGWYVCPSAGKWGLKNNMTDDNVVPPEYDYITVNSELGLTLVEIKDRRYKYKMGDTEFSVTSRFGLVDHITGKFLAEPYFWEIRWQDFLLGDKHVARCIKVGGKHGVMKRSGHVLYGNMIYIGDFINGYARFNVAGELTCTSKDTREVLSSLNHYVENMNMVIRNPGQQLQSLWLKCEGGKWGYMDVDGRIVVGVQYDYADVARNSIFTVKSNKKWGAVTIDDGLQIPFIYSNIEYLKGSENNLFVVEKNGEKYGFINSKGEVIASTKYDDSRLYSEGMVAVKLDNKWGFLNDKGDMVIDTIFDMAKDFNNGLAAVRIKRKWGYVDMYGNFAIEPIYLRAENFSEGLAAVRIKGRGGIGYINNKGKVLIDPIFLKCFEFKNGVAKVKYKGRYGVIDRNGEWVVKPNYKKIELLDNSLIVLKKGSTYGVVRNDGTRLLRTKYTKIGEFSEGMAMVKTKQKNKPFIKGQYKGFVNTTGEMVVSPVYKYTGNFHDGLAAIWKDGKYGFIDKNGDVVIQPQFKMAWDFSEGKAIVYYDKKYCLINTEGEIIYTHPDGKIIGSFSNGKVIVKDKKGTYFIDSFGNNRLGTYYDDATNFSDGMAKVKLNDKWAVIDQNGFYFLAPKFDEIEDFKDGKAKVKCSRFIGISDQYGKIIVSPNYDNVQYLNEGIYKVERNNEVGYLTANGDWVWEPQK